MSRVLMRWMATLTIAISVHYLTLELVLPLHRRQPQGLQMWHPIFEETDTMFSAGCPLLVWPLGNIRGDEKQVALQKAVGWVGLLGARTKPSLRNVPSRELWNMRCNTDFLKKKKSCVGWKDRCRSPCTGSTVHFDLTASWFLPQWCRSIDISPSEPACLFLMTAQSRDNKLWDINRDNAGAHWRNLCVATPRQLHLVVLQVVGLWFDSNIYLASINWYQRLFQIIKYDGN